MKLHFDPAMVRKLRDHALKAKVNKPLYGDKSTAKPGLWLVGDQGVYLMSNGEPGLKAPKGAKEIYVVAYARECDPHKLSFDEWWGNKQASFGGDDGAEFIDAKDIPADGDIIIEMSSTQMAILTKKAPRS